MTRILALSSLPYDVRVHFGKRFPEEVSARLQIPLFYVRAKHVGWYYLGFFLGIAGAIPRFYLAARKSQVILCFIPYLLPLAFVARKPVIFVAVDDYEGTVYPRKLKRLVYKILKPIYFKHCVHCISTTQTVATKLVEYNDHVSVVRVGINTAEFVCNPLETPLKIVCYVGKLRYDYNVELIITAITMLSHVVDCHIVGDGSDLNRLKLLAPLNVKFYGKMTHEQTRTIIQNAHICILPIGLLAIKLYQYMAAGKPIIALHGQVEEILQHNVNAILIDNKAVDLAIAIDYLLDNPKIAQQLGQNAQKTIKNQDWSIIIPQLQHILDENYDRKKH